MTKKKQIKTIDEIQSLLDADYNLRIEQDTDDYHTVAGEIYLSTKKAADLFRTGYHAFSVKYTAKLKDAGVRVSVCGRHKFYSVTDLLYILNESIKNNKTIFEICKSESKKER